MIKLTNILKEIKIRSANRSDLHSNESLLDFFNQNIKEFIKYEGIDTADSLILSTDMERPVVTMGMKNMIVIQTPDVLMICPRGESQRVKELVNYLKASDYTLIL